MSSSQSEDTVDCSKAGNALASQNPDECHFISQPPVSVEMKEGEDLKIFCNILGSPEPEITWFKDNMPLKDDYRIDIYSDRGARYLEICDAKMSDSGEYTIFARNQHNKVSAKTAVKVVENPKKLQRPNIEGLYHYGTR